MRALRLWRASLALTAAIGALRAAAPAIPWCVDGATPLAWSERMARSAMARAGDSLACGAPGAKWDYSPAVLALALCRLEERTGDAAYGRFAERAVGSYIAPDGEIRTYRMEEFSLDQINPGKVILALYERTGEKRYALASERLRRQLAIQPRTAEGGFWHKQRYPHQMWLDGLFMASPFLAQYGRLFHEPADFDEVARQIRVVGVHTYDSASGLFFHGWDESRSQPWADRRTGTSPCFWGRALGWYGMAMVDALDDLPADHWARREIVARLGEWASGILRYQDPASGEWYQVVDQGPRSGNYLEASGSAMAVYTLAKGVNRGYLPRSLASAIRRGYDGLVGRFLRHGKDGSVSLTRICQTAGLGYGRDGSFAYYIGEPIVADDYKGVGPFILAGIEADRLGVPP